MKNNDLLKKIGKYSMAAGATVLAGNLANAATQTTITSINLTPGSHGIDFDGDGNNELVLNGNSSSSSFWSTYYGARMNIALGSDADATTFQVIHNGPFDSNADPAAFPADRIIGATLSGSSNWSNSNYDTVVMSYYGYIYDGNFGFYPDETRYLGVRYSNDGGTNWYYGWIGINIDSSPNLLSDGTFGQVVNYAYEDNVNTPLLAGAGSSTPVPMSPWATGLGIGLIGLYGFYKTRRKVNA